MPENTQNQPGRSKNDMLVWRVRHAKAIDRERHVGHVYSLHAADHKGTTRKN